MCGKFSQLASWQDVHAFSQPLEVNEVGEEVVATPMRFARIMRLDEAGERELVAMRWGFWGRGEATPSRPRHIHARCETIDAKPTFQQSFARRRGILMVHTFNEGEELPNGKTKQWVIEPTDSQPIAIAVVYWASQDSSDPVQTFVQVTTPANTLISRITDRMPAILPRKVWPIWLGETQASLDDIKALLLPFDDNGGWRMREQSPSRLAKPKPLDSQQSLF